MTGQPDNQGHRVMYHCPACGKEFFDPMLSAGYPCCPKCFMALPANARVVAKPNRVFITMNARTGDPIPAKPVVPGVDSCNAPAGGVVHHDFDALFPEPSKKVFRDHVAHPIIHKPSNEDLIHAAIKRHRNAGITVHHAGHGTDGASCYVSPKNNDFDE
jgi:hypothetical protein